MLLAQQLLQKKIPFNVKSGTGAWDEQSEFDVTTNIGRFTANAAGYYQVNSRVEVTLTGTITNRTYITIIIRANGTDYSYGNYLYTFATNNISPFLSPIVSDIVYLNAGEYIEIYVLQNTGALGTMTTGSGKTYVSIHKLS